MRIFSRSSGATAVRDLLRRHGDGMGLTALVLAAGGDVAYHWQAIQQMRWHTSQDTPRAKQVLTERALVVHCAWCLQQ